MTTPPAPDLLPPAPEDRISPVQLEDILRFINEQGFYDSTGEYLWGLHQEILMGEGDVWVRQEAGRKTWALKVPTTQGTRIVLEDLSLHEALLEGEWVRTHWREHDDLDRKTAARAGRGMLSSAGVGLLFESSRPLDAQEGEDLVEAMWGYSCHPYLGRRIVADLNAHGRRAATVMPHLIALIPDMEEQFRPFGVSVKRCWPMPSRGKPQVPEAERDVPMPRRIPKPR